MKTGPGPGRGCTDLLYDEVSFVGPPIRAAAEGLRYGLGIKLATLNVQSLCRPAVHRQLLDYMNTYGVDILCMQETRVSQATQYVVDKSLFLVIGQGEPGREYAGVGFVIGPRTRRALAGVVVHVPGRLVSVVLNTAPRVLTVICAYIPQSGRPEDEPSSTFDELSRAVSQASHRGITIVLGDFNARLHGRLRGESDILGPEIFGSGVGRLLAPDRGEAPSSNRDMLMALCAEHGLRVMNTWFRKPDSHRVTFVAPGVGTLPPGRSGWDPAEFAVLDLCLVSSRWKGVVRDVRSRPSAGLPSDHFPLEIEVLVKLGASRATAPIKRWDFRTATEEQVQGFDAAVLEAADGVRDASSVQEAWETLERTVNEALDKWIPAAGPKAKRPWIGPWNSSVGLCW